METTGGLFLMLATVVGAWNLLAAVGMGLCRLLGNTTVDFVGIPGLVAACVAGAIYLDESAFRWWALLWLVGEPIVFFAPWLVRDLRR